MEAGSWGGQTAGLTQYSPWQCYKQNDHRKNIIRVFLLLLTRTRTHREPKPNKWPEGKSENTLDLSKWPQFLWCGRDTSPLDKLLDAQSNLVTEKNHCYGQTFKPILAPAKKRHQQNQPCSRIGSIMFCYSLQTILLTPAYCFSAWS